MNERIQELAKQAKLWAIDHTTFPISSHIPPGYTQKLAELIVRECASVAQDFVTVENNKAVEKIHISPWHLQDKIKEHFGVEP